VPGQGTHGRKSEPKSGGGRKSVLRPGSDSLCARARKQRRRRRRGRRRGRLLAEVGAVVGRLLLLFGRVGRRARAHAVGVGVGLVAVAAPLAPRLAFADGFVVVDGLARRRRHRRCRRRRRRTHPAPDLSAPLAATRSDLGEKILI